MSDRRCCACRSWVRDDAPGRTFGHEMAVGFVCNRCIDEARWAAVEEAEQALFGADPAELPLDRIKRRAGDRMLPGFGPVLTRTDGAGGATAGGGA